MLNNGYKYNTLEKDIKNIDKVPLSEYPRPNLKRDSYLCLNGYWDIEIKKDTNLPSNYNEKCLVPFAIETPASGVNHLLECDEYIFYHREIDVSEFKDNDHIILHFDGVDQIAEVFINNEFVLKHVGGYTKFSLDIKKYVKDKTKLDLTLKVRDLTDTSYYSRGKQSLNPKDWIYSSSSGIYKPVWIEGVNDNYIESIKYRSDFDKKLLYVLVSTKNDTQAQIKINNNTYNIITNKENTIDLSSDFHPWSNVDPYLYNITISTNNDHVLSYFGIRKIETKKIDNHYQVLLNNKKIIINGLLDQGYYYGGYLTPTSYKDYYNDIKRIKDLGYNTLRKHVKIEDDLFYYYCDLLGIFVIQDFVNGGTRYKMINAIKPGMSYKLFNNEKFLNYKDYGREEEENRTHFLNEINEIYNSLYSFPSILIFTIFNEAWGEFDPSIIYKHFKEIDMNSHLFDTASGWLDTTNSDFFSVHSYHFYKKRRKDKFNHRPYFLSETGGIGLIIKDHFPYKTLFGHHNAKTKEELTKKYKKLYEISIIPKFISGEMCGVIYTQLNDCETEGNGIFTFDREVLKVDEGVLKELNNKINNI